MTDEKKEIEQALEAAAMELKAKGAAMDPEAAEAPEAPAPEAEAEQTAEAKPEEKEAAEPEKPSEQKAKEKAKSKTAKPDDRKKSASALKELARVRRNKIIGITAAVIAVMVGIFLLARNDLKSNNHGGEPTVMEDGTKVYPDGAKELADGTVINPDGTTEQPDGTVISPDGTITQADGTVVTPPPVQPGDSNVSNVAADNGGAGGEADTPWSTMTDGDYQIAIRRLNAYDGPFLEDGSDETVSNVLALQFRNDGEQDVQYAEYVFDINGEEVAFKLSNLPAGQRCVVLAANRHAFNANEVLKLKSRLVAHVDYLPTADDQLLLVNNGDDTITVMNLTDHEIPLARVFYKTYYAEQESFIGGITYSVELKNLPAGGSSGAVAPSHFSADYSRFVGSGVYEG